MISHGVPVTPVRVSPAAVEGGVPQAAWAKGVVVDVHETSKSAKTTLPEAIMMENGPCQDHFPLQAGRLSTSIVVGGRVTKKMNK